MFEIILLAYLTFRNSMRAKLKGLNPILWGFLTVVSFLSALFIGCLVVVLAFCADVIDVNSLSSKDPEVRAAVSKQLVDTLNANPLHVLTIELFAIGGYLLIRYILDNKPDKKTPEIHWSDRLGENR